MSSILKLIRLPNLLMLLVTVFIYGQHVLYATIARYGFAPSFVFKDFVSLLFIFACVAAAGYIHNDITDIKTDHTNDKRQIIGQTIAKWVAWVLLAFFIFSPLPLVFYLCSEINNFDYILYYFLVIAILLAYNKWFQRFPLIGNIIVAATCGLVILLPALAEIRALFQVRLASPIAYRQFWIITIGFVAFSFFANLIREIIKDIEDIEGDNADHYRTLPIVIGIKKTTHFILFLQVVFIILLLVWMNLLVLSNTIMITLIVLMIGPMIFVMYKTWLASETEHFADLTTWMKVYFAAGIIALFLIN